LKLGHDEVIQFLGGIVARVGKIPDFNPKISVNYKLDESNGYFFPSSFDVLIVNTWSRSL